ncbi:MAG: hypothetical protein UY72_C0043G0003 [Candidatus Uhrbacteria bacterium GW2011_GWD2_52_7]|uniref:Uncharacterized protein n=1 Tax=Candidatus Uhrbacteria bacterium GW2011_GWD2_52_7 TaxID=1618989 RepID=A0A0G1ZMX8_9BACT|nr:MAG: hypothetical protein UY72_C0043G0003 [Candidatus Uhrbacteria bacterium GW2011_GWD2_52_7]
MGKRRRRAHWRGVEEVGLVEDDVVGHAAGEPAPVLTGSRALYLLDRHAEHEEEIYGAVEVGPLVAVPVHAGVEEAPPAALALQERIGELVEHGHDFLRVALETTGMEADRHHDARGADMATGVFVAFEQAVAEDRGDAFVRENSVAHSVSVVGMRRGSGPEMLVLFYEKVNENRLQSACSAAQ